MRSKIVQTLSSLKKAASSYPLFLICAFILMYAIQVLIHDSSGESFPFVKLAFTAALGISTCFALAIVGQRYGRKWLWYGLGVLFLVAFYFIVLPQEEKQFTEIYVFVMAPAFVLSHLFVSIAPFLKGRQEENRFWQYNKTLFVNFCLTLIFTGVFIGGVQLALLAMDHLFALNWSSDVYIRVFFGILTFGSAIIFGLFHIEGLARMEERSPYPIVIAFFTQFILIPLLLLYVGILYIYGIKILIVWELPRGWVSTLVLAYGVLGILALLLVHPLLEGKSRAWVDWFKKIFYYSLLPLLVLLFMSIGTRISEYGFTEARYFVLLLAIWLTFVTLYFIAVKNTSIKTIPYSLFVVGMLSLLLPYINVYAVSVRSQEKAVIQLLESNMLLQDGKLDSSRPVSRAVVGELQDKYVYLYQRGKEESLWPMLNEASLVKIKESPWAFKGIFTQIIIDGNDRSNLYFELRNTNSIHDIEGYNYMVKYEYEQELKFAIGLDSVVVRKSTIKDTTQFSLTISESAIDLLPLVDSLVQPHLDTYNDRDLDDMSISFDHAGYHCKVIFDQISVDATKEKPRYYFNKMTFLFRKQHE